MVGGDERERRSGGSYRFWGVEWGLQRGGIGGETAELAVGVRGGPHGVAGVLWRV